MGSQEMADADAPFGTMLMMSASTPVAMLTLHAF
jgi:hypothetical protein